MVTSESEKKIVDMKDNESLEPVSWATLFCRMFAHISKEVVERFGDEGEEAIKAGVRAFGIEHGRIIAELAKENGCDVSPESYLTNYDMGRGNDFTAQNIYSRNEVQQLFTQCGFAEQWIKDGMEKYGKLYCDVINPAIAEGYSEDLECIHDRRVYENGVCSFCFRMKKKEA